jgi:acyl carrier protein
MNLVVEAQIRKHFEQRLRLKGDTSALGNADALFSTARLDSLDAVETIMFVEEAFGIDFAEINYDLTLLDSVSAIVHLVERQSSMRAA